MNAITHAATQLVVGTPMGGGFFAGQYRIGDEVFGLIVAPKKPGEISSKWNDTLAAITGAASYNDGHANTIAMADAGSVLGKWACSLDIAGLTDWYLPSRDELELMYRNLKPTSKPNYCSFRDGDNASSIPLGYPYTPDTPAQTIVEVFRDGGADAFDSSWYWASTQYSAYADYAWGQSFNVGVQGNGRKTFEGRARAVRRFAL